MIYEYLDIHLDIFIYIYLLINLFSLHLYYFKMLIINISENLLLALYILSTSLFILFFK